MHFLTGEKDEESWECMRNFTQVPIDGFLTKTPRTFQTPVIDYIQHPKRRQIQMDNFLVFTPRKKSYLVTNTQAPLGLTKQSSLDGFVKKPQDIRFVVRVFTCSHVPWYTLGRHGIIKKATIPDRYTQFAGTIPVSFWITQRIALLICFALFLWTVLVMCHFVATPEITTYSYSYFNFNLVLTKVPSALLSKSISL